MKKIMSVLAIILIVIFIIVIINKNKKEDVQTEQIKEEKYVDVLQDGTKLNTSEALNKDRNINGLKFENIQLTNRNGQTVLLADVTNTTSNTSEMLLFDVIILDENGNELGKVAGILAPLKAGEKTQFNSSMTVDYSNAYDFKIIKK